MKKLNQEFESFTQMDLQPSGIISQRILEKVHSHMNPSQAKVFFKLIAIHSMVSVATMSLCPQFGVRVFGEGAGLTRYFMTMGMSACMTFCGVLFLGISFLLAPMLMSRFEVKALHNFRMLHLLLVGVLSLAFFMNFDAEAVFEYSVYWLSGALVGGYLFFSIGQRLKNYLYSMV